MDILEGPDVTGRSCGLMQQNPVKVRTADEKKLSITSVKTLSRDTGSSLL